MNTKWKYKVDLITQDAFTKVERKMNVKIPEELKILIMEANGASPIKQRVMINKEEKIVGEILSYNENEQEADDVYTALKSIHNQSLIPFALDPFGNYFCLSGITQTVVFWDHEVNKIINTEKKLEEFVYGLY